jgi:predicted DNA-binding protein
VTTTLSRRQKAELDRLAKSQGVKVAWLVRRAVEKLLEETASGTTLPLDLDGGGDGKR